MILFVVQVYQAPKSPAYVSIRIILDQIHDRFCGMHSRKYFAGLRSRGNAFLTRMSPHGFCARISELSPQLRRLYSRCEFENLHISREISRPHCSPCRSVEKRCIVEKNFQRFWQGKYFENISFTVKIAR